MSNREVGYVSCVFINHRSRIDNVGRVFGVGEKASPNREAGQTRPYEN